MERMILKLRALVAGWAVDIAIRMSPLLADAIARHVTQAVYARLDTLGYAIVPKAATSAMLLAMSNTAVNDHGVMLPCAPAAEVWLEGVLHAPKPPGAA